MDKKSLLNFWLLLLCMIVGSGTAWAEDKTSTLVFSAKCNGSGTADDGAAWTVTSDGTESNFDNTKGIHYGTNSAQVKYIQLSTSGIPGTITKVVVNASAASGVSATVSVTVGGSAFGGDAKSVTSSAANYTFEGSASGEIVVTLQKPSKASKALYVKSVAVTYTSGGGDTPTLENCDLALTDAPVELTFDLYNNASAQVINYTTSSTGAVTIADSEYATFAINGTAKTITVTPTAVTPSMQTITVNQAADETYKAGSATFTLTITDSTPLPTYTVTFSDGGSVTQESYGASVTLPSRSETAGYAFAGWSETNVASETTEAPTIIPAGSYTPTANITLYPVYTKTEGGGGNVNKTASVNIATYATAHSWSNSIQYETVSLDENVTATANGTNNTGKYYTTGNEWRFYQNENAYLVIETTSGTLTSAKITYNISNTGQLTYEETVVISGSEIDLSGTSACFWVENSGSATNGQVKITAIEVNYSITGGGTTYYWSAPVAAAVEKPTITVAESPFLFSTSVKITCKTDGATIYYTLDGTDPTDASTEYSDAFEITSACTIKAIAIKGSDESSIATLAVEKNKATPTVTVSGDLTVDLNGETDVNAGTLTAAVTYNEAAVDGATVTWISSNSDVASIDAETGVVTIKTTGEVTFTATYAGNGDYAEATGTKTITVTDSKAPGMKNNPYTVAQARAAIDAGTGVTGVYAKGIVSTAGSLSSGAISYYISDDGTKTNELQAYKGKSYNGDNFTSADDIQVGDVVVIYGNLKKYNAIYEFDANNQLVSLVRKPSITATPSPFAAPSYKVGTAEPTCNSLTVNGKNLTADITLTLDENSNFEMSTDLENWTSTLTITQSEGSVTDEEVAVRLKAGLEKGNYAGEITLTSTGADNVVIAVSGTVTGQTYTISVDDNVTGGTIEADMASAEEGATVTLTATPDAAYTFGSWTVYKDDMSTEVTVTDNQFTMPACEVYVTATFNAKPTYAVTCVANPVAGGTMEASPASAYEGQTVTLSYVAEDGYSLSSIVITKTSDGSATEITPVASGDDFTFTMPDYAVTATAIFESNTFEGSFAQVTSISALEDGGYYILYRQSNAMNSTLTSGKMGATEIYPTNGFFENPDKSIVWKLVKNGDKWDLYSEKEGKYCYIEGTNTSSFKMAATASYHYTITAAGDGFFKFKTTHSSSRGIEYGNKDFGSYADSNNPKVYLYKYTTLTERTITFNGNGGTTETDASEYTQTVYDGVEATLDANTFANNGYEFAGWNTENNGSGTAYADKANITVTGGDLTLYAQWAPLYTLTIDNNIEGGSVSVEGDVTTASEGTEITLSYLASAGHAFNSWNVYKADDETTKVIVTNNKFDMPAYNVVVSASFDEIPTYSLATSITPGKHYIIASGTDGSVKAMGKQNDNNRSAVSVTSSNGIIPETTGVYEFVIYGPDANGYYTIYDCDEEASGYLYAASSGSNYLKTQATNDMDGKWSISIDGETKDASIVAQGNNTRNVMQYNSSSTLFSCYGSASQSDVYLYEKDDDTPVATTASVKLNASGYATFATTSALDFLGTEDADFSAWQITDIDGSYITFSQITTTVEAGTGILVKGTPGATVNLNILPVGGVKLGENKLEGITEATAIESDTYYGLSGNKFVKVNAGTVPAGKALLPASEISASARELTFVFNDGTTGISSIENVQLTNDKYYNLNGQRVENPKKGGLYIVNGKKVIMK